MHPFQAYSEKISVLMRVFFGSFFFGSTSGNKLIPTKFILTEFRTLYPEVQMYKKNIIKKHHSSRQI